jgi:hypothetical protein
MLTPIMCRLAVVGLILLVLLLGGCSGQGRGTSYSCDEGNDNCSTCYWKLVYETITPEKNQFNMQRAFFPDKTSSPVYVTVYYYFDEADKPEPKTFFWSESTFFASFLPLPIYQYTSLFFGDYEFRTEFLNLTLDSECLNATEEKMAFLTQRVSCLFGLYVGV